MKTFSKFLNPSFSLVLLMALSSLSAQESMLCMGAHWSEDEANQRMKEFRSSWNDLESWGARADMIRQGIRCP